MRQHDGRGASLSGKGAMSRAVRARRLRQQAGFGEGVVWTVLRAGRAGGLKFRRQHPIDRFVVDFACPDLMLVIEIDGEVHDLPDVRARDAERTTQLELLGWTVLRFTNDVAVTRTTEILDAIRRHAQVIGRG